MKWMLQDGCVQGIRLQPLMSLQSLTPFGLEGLSLLDPPVLTELFFKYLPAETALSLFLLQAEILSQKYPDSRLLLNLPVRVLQDTANLDRLLTPRRDLSRNVGIEIQDPEALAGMSGTERHCLVVTLMVLREEGWSLWMDDLTPALLPEVGSLCMTFDGVKIDRHEIRRRRYEPQALAHLVSRCQGLGKQVVVEGIETEADMRHAQASGAEIGQGYYWPETVLHLPRPLRGLL
ncbi:EAL domain-containing protein [Enterobacter ludwigii]|uniref:EAL domain-containing protein n=1 Tax=Enterobacter ludwigii TaxID=299767 RepID=UPI003976A151